MLAMLFILSLYIWKNDKARDHDETIRKRFISMALCCLASPIFVMIFIKAFDPEEDCLVWLGLSPTGLVSALVLPLVLTATLFFGPIFDHLVFQRQQYSMELPDMGNLRILRNYVVAPLAEELVFRVCICSLLVFGGWSKVFAGVVAPLMFGFAHLHHVLEHISAGHDFSRALQIAGFQTCYTTLFGMYAAFLFFRTGHLVSPFISHAFCNYMGLPEIGRLMRGKYRHILTVAYLAGIAGFITLLMPLTAPEWYSPRIWEFQLS